PVAPSRAASRATKGRGGVERARRTGERRPAGAQPRIASPQARNAACRSGSTTWRAGTLRIEASRRSAGAGSARSRDAVEVFLERLEGHRFDEAAVEPCLAGAGAVLGATVTGEGDEADGSEIGVGAEGARHVEA